VIRFTYIRRQAPHIAVRFSTPDTLNNTIMTKRNKLSANDLSLISCPFDSNALASRLSRVTGLLDDITVTDLLIMDDQSASKEIHRLRNMLKKAEQLADSITSKYNDARYQRDKKYW
jgi:hypothetical protein